MKNVILVSFVALILSGCDYWQKEEPPLPGTRVSVLQHERSLTADAEVANTEILLPAPTINKAWPQSGGYANHAMHHVKVHDNLKVRWIADLGATASDERRLGGEPISSEGRIYAMNVYSSVYAIDEKTGRTVWRSIITPKDDDDDHISGGLAYSEGRVFAGTGFAQVVALDAASGNELWRVKVDAPVRAAPTVRAGRVFAVTLNNKLFALDAETGEELWTHSGLPETASILGGASPAVDRGIVVVPYTSGQIVALRADTGRLVWEESLTSIRRTDVISTLADIRGRPVIDRNRVVAMSNGGQIVSIDLRTGRRIWVRDIGGLESPWVAGDYIYALTSEAEIICISREDGRVYWVRALPRFEDPDDLDDPIIWTGPILTSDRLIVAGSNGEALAISPYTGDTIGEMEMPDAVSIPPIVANGSVYFLTDNAQIVAYQ